MPIRALLRLETGLALALAWALVFLVPLRWARRLFGPPVLQRPAADASLPRARAVARRVVQVAGRLPWHSTCLVRAVAGALLLARRGIPGAVVRFGVRKTQGRLEAHAWLVLGDAVLLGGEEEGSFVPLADLGHPACGSPGS